MTYYSAAPNPGDPLRQRLRRLRYLLDYTVIAMQRRKGRHLSILLVYSSLIFLLASVLFYTSALKHEAARLLAVAPEAVVQKITAGRHDLIPEDYQKKLRIRGVQSIQGRLWGYHYDPVVRANYTLQVPGPDLPTPANGATLTPGNTWIGPALARARGAGVGDLITFRSHQGELMAFAITAVLPTQTNLVSADLILITEADFRRLFGISDGYFTDFTLRIANPNEVANVAEKVLAALPDTRIILREDMLRTYAAVFDWRSTLVLLVLLGTLLAFALLVLTQASGLSGDERREIGILKAIGWETRDVLQMKLLEGALLSVLAFLLGVSVAYWHVFGWGAPMLAIVMQGWSVLYPAFPLTPVLDPTPLLTLFFLTVLPYTAATIVPSWRAAIMDPDTVMR